MLVEAPGLEPDVTLRVEAQHSIGGARLSYRVDSKLEFIVGGWRKLGTIELDSTPTRFQQSLVEEIRSLYRGLDPAGAPLQKSDVSRYLEARGRALHQQLLPRELRRFLARLERAETLMIVSDEPWIPWELMCDEEGRFLALRFALTRWLPAAPAPPSELKIRNIACLAAGGINQVRLKGPQKEAGYLRELARERELEYTSLENPDWSETVELLAGSEIDLLHFAGHGEVDLEQPELASLQLAELGRWRALDLFDPSKTAWASERPIIFANACFAGGLGFGLSGLDGWPSSSIRQVRASAFVGPSWSVRDDRSFQFSKAFYGALIAGSNLGRAGRDAREHIWRSELGAAEAFAYRIYGHPEASVVLE